MDTRIVLSRSKIGTLDDYDKPTQLLPLTHLTAASWELALQSAVLMLP